MMARRWAAREVGSWRTELKGAGPTPYSRTADGRAVFEILAARNTPALLAKLADYVIETHHPELAVHTGRER